MTLQPDFVVHDAPWTPHVCHALAVILAAPEYQMPDDLYYIRALACCCLSQEAPLASPDSPPLPLPAFWAEEPPGLYLGDEVAHAFSSYKGLVEIDYSTLLNGLTLFSEFIACKVRSLYEHAWAALHVANDNGSADFLTVVEEIYARTHLFEPFRILCPDTVPDTRANLEVFMQEGLKIISRVPARRPPEAQEIWWQVGSDAALQGIALRLWMEHQYDCRP